MKDITFTDRYKATGTPYPDENSCDECEGMGIFPVQYADVNRCACEAPSGRLTIIGQKQEDGKPMPEDGWLFAECPACKGARKK